MATTLGMPTQAQFQGALTSYGVGLMSGIGYNIASGFTGSGLIGSALSAAIIGATVRGPVGDSIAAILGFQAGQAGLGALGLGNLGLGNGGRNGRNGNGPPPLTLI
jgi:hypothetical protein